MQFSDNNYRDFFVYLLILWALLLSGCDQSQPQMADGIEGFKSIAQEILNKLEKGEIKRNSGFFIECAVDNRREKGIRISETVCDKENTRTITIRVTDPTSRPPSQRVETIKLSTLTLNIKPLALPVRSK